MQNQMKADELKIQAKEFKYEVQRNRFKEADFKKNSIIYLNHYSPNIRRHEEFSREHRKSIFTKNRRKQIENIEYLNSQLEESEKIKKQDDKKI